MVAARKLAVTAVIVCCLGVVGLAVAEETQDSPLYAYTLRTTLERMEGETTLVDPQRVPEDESGVFLPEPVQLQAATSQPVGPTVCNRVRTVCPTRLTACPKRQPTVCPQKTTTCPLVTTYCPVATTACPARGTRCPAGATSCPYVRTQCPQHVTRCPKNQPTVCPQKTTNCPAQATYCPLQETICPPTGTRCPAAATQCPYVRTQCPQHLTRCPPEVPTACPERGTQCPVTQSVCPHGATHCPVVNTACPVRPTVCPPNCAPGTGLITITSPTGDPTVSAAAEFSYDANNPGVCVINVQLAVNAAGRPNIANELRVSIDPVTGSALQWQTTAGVGSPWIGSPLGQPPGAHPTMGHAQFINGVWQVSALYTGLPPSNGAFGPKTIYVQIIDANGVVVSEAQQNIEIFYDRIATNNPGTGVNQGPNWFYYWKTGGCVNGSPHDWQYETIPGLFGYYNPGEDHVNVGDAAMFLNTGPETYTKDDGVTTITVTGVPSVGPPPSGRGPWCCAETVAHEGYHKWIEENYAPLITTAEAGGQYDGDPYDDPDNDGIPNMIEPMIQFYGVNGNPLTTDANDPDTYNMDAMWGPGSSYAGYGDQEMRCRAVELNTAFVGVGVNGALDWSFPGWNTVPPYP